MRFSFSDEKFSEHDALPERARSEQLFPIDDLSFYMKGDIAEVAAHRDHTNHLARATILSHNEPRSARDLYRAISTESPIADLILNVLPNELMWEVFGQLDIRSIIRFRQVNRLAAKLVHEFPPFHLVIKHARTALMALSGVRLAHHYTIVELAAVLRKHACAGDRGRCPGHGDYLFLPTLQRVCQYCTMMDPYFTVFMIPAAPEVVYIPAPFSRTSGRAGQEDDPYSDYEDGGGGSSNCNMMISGGETEWQPLTDRRAPRAFLSLPGKYWCKRNSPYHERQKWSSWNEDSNKQNFSHRRVWMSAAGPDTNIWALQEMAIDTPLDYQMPQFRLTAFVKVPFVYESPTGPKAWEGGVRCKGCRWVVTKLVPQSRGSEEEFTKMEVKKMEELAEREYTLAGFLEHFVWCREAQWVWTHH